MSNKAEGVDYGVDYVLQEGVAPNISYASIYASVAEDENVGLFEINEAEEAIVAEPEFDPNKIYLLSDEDDNCVGLFFNEDGLLTTICVFGEDFPATMANYIQQEFIQAEAIDLSEFLPSS